jgi:hypothetical protein
MLLFQLIGNDVDDYYYCLYDGNRYTDCPWLRFLFYFNNVSIISFRLANLSYVQALRFNDKVSSLDLSHLRSIPLAARTSVLLDCILIVEVPNYILGTEPIKYNLQYITTL